MCLLVGCQSLLSDLLSVGYQTFDSIVLRCFTWSSKKYLENPSKNGNLYFKPKKKNLENAQGFSLKCFQQYGRQIGVKNFTV